MKIIGTGSALPSLVVTNDMLADFLETNDEWIASRTGIKARRLRSTETLVDLSVSAARSALESANLTPDEIDFCIVSNVANNYVTPAMSCIIQQNIGSHAPCFDLNGACAGFLDAMEVAEALLKTNRATNILIVCAEEPSRFCNWKRRETCILFADGAGAVVVTKGNDLKAIKLTTTPNRDAIVYRRRMEDVPFEGPGVDVTEPLLMNGREVFRLAVESSQRDLRAVIEEAKLTPDKIDLYLLHQANLRIIDSIREHLSQPEYKFPTNIQRTGNISSASIPILIDELYSSGKLKKGDMIALSAFGAGFVTGAAVLKWTK